LVCHYVETHGLNDCLVYTTEQATASPCHESRVRFRLDLSQSQLEERLGEHVKLLQTGWHCLYWADEYAVEALEALSWFEEGERQGWMPRDKRYAFGSWNFDPDGILKLKATFDAAESLSKIIRPQPEWGVFSERLAKTITDEFLKRTLKGESLDPQSFCERACLTFKRGLRLAPWLGQLYELGYCQNDGRLFFGGGDEVCMFEEEEGFGPRVVSLSTDGTTGSVREAVRRLPLPGEHSGSAPLKYFHGEHPEIFKRMTERDPDLLHRLAVKILFKD
jgi:transcriptional regulator with XRE-family HTH domain